VAPELDAVIQFEVGGPEPEAYHLRIRNGGCTFHLRHCARPTLTITTPSDVWLRISSGELSGRQAFLDGLYQAEGDSNLLMSLERLFRPRATLSLAGHGRPAGPVALGGMTWLAVAFAPWMAMWLGLPWPAALGGAVVMAAYRARVRELTWFEAGSVLCFAVLSVVALVAGNWMARWGTVAGTLALAGLWLAPTAVRSPALSAAYSKWKYVPALWSNATFLHVNAVISLAWGCTFIGQGLVELGARLAPHLAEFLIPTRWLVLIPAILLTLRLPPGAPDRAIPDLDRSPARLQRVAALALAAGLAAMLLTVRA
jgi:hypothetical protein